MLVEYPKGLGCVENRTTADGQYAIRLELAYIFEHLVYGISGRLGIHVSHDLTNPARTSQELPYLLKSVCCQCPAVNNKGGAARAQLVQVAQGAPATHKFRVEVKRVVCHVITLQIERTGIILHRSLLDCLL
jgi:hypothetical protein